MSTSPIYVSLYSSVLLISTAGLFAKGIPLDAMSIIQLRSVIAAAAIILFLIVLKRSIFIEDNKKILGVYLLGTLLGLHWVTYFHSMQVSTIAIGMIALFTFPVMVVLMEAAIQRTQPRWKDIIAALLVLTGVLLMALNETKQPGMETIQGIFWGVISALLFSSRSIIQKYYFADIPSDTLMLHQTIAIALMLLLFVDFPTVNNLTDTDWINLLLLGLFATALGHTLLTVSFKNFAVRTVSMVSCLQPVFGALLAWLFIKEQPTLFVALGGFIILMVALYESMTSSKT